MTNTPNNPVAMEATVAAAAVPTGAAAGAAGDVRDPGSSPGILAPVPTSPLEPKRGRPDDHDPGKPLFAFAAIHARQDTTDDELAKLRTELNAVKAVLDQVVKEGAGSSAVESLKSEVQALREEVKANGGSKLAEDVVECLRAIETNDLAQKTSLQLFEKLVMDEKSKLATPRMDVDLFRATPSPSTVAATFGHPP